MEKSIEKHIQPQLFDTKMYEGLSDQSFLNEETKIKSNEHNLPHQFVLFVMKDMIEVE